MDKWNRFVALLLITLLLGGFVYVAMGNTLMAIYSTLVAVLLITVSIWAKTV